MGFFDSLVKTLAEQAANLEKATEYKAEYETMSNAHLKSEYERIKWLLSKIIIICN